MVFFRKENVFMCLVVFQKNFRKIFSGVWKMLQGKDKPRKHGQNPDWRSMLDWVRRRSASRAPVRRPRRRSRSREASRRFARSRSTARSHEASIAISRRRDRNLELQSTALVLANGADWSLVRANGVDWCVRASLSLSLRNSFEVKIGTKIYFRSQSLFFSVNGNQFSKNFIFRTNQIPTFPKKYFQKWFSPKTNTA